MPCPIVLSMHKRQVAVLLLLLPCCLTFAPPLAGQFGPPKKPIYPWSNPSLSPDQRADLVIARMTIDEKIQLVHGAGLAGVTPTEPAIVRSNGGGGFVPGIQRLGLPDLNMSDSAVGVAGSGSKGRYSTALPSSLALASSWDTALAREYGSLIGEELANEGFNVSLAGGVDITREPRNGRNFEYAGEDPILAGNLVAQLIEGIQSQGVIGDVKHYALNDQETGRFFSNSILDKRAMRESDLLAFEIAVKQARPGMVMCSYNLINGTHACENEYTLNQVLKKEWGFQGWVISDWTGTHSTEKAALAGLDQEQPAFEFFGPKLKAAVLSGRVPMARLNDMVHRILRTEFAIGLIDHPRSSGVPDVAQGLAFARRVEEQSAVLLKNSDHQLPLNGNTLASIAVIGSHADVGVLSGGGSAQVSQPNGGVVPWKGQTGTLSDLFSAVVWDPSSPLKAIQAHSRKAHVTYNPGTDTESAASAARAADVAIVFVHQHMHEGSDALTLELPGNQDRIVEAVAGANPHTVVVLETGAPVSMPWADRVSAILEAWYPGIQGAEAIANLLFGEVNPSGKLPVTFARSDADLPHPKLPAPPGPIPTPMDGITTHPPNFDVTYTEGLKVGYKWYDAERKQPLFPFGFGLSFTTYSYSDLKADPGSKLSVSFVLRNSGERAGDEIAQVYLTFPHDSGEPPKRLIGWQKVHLASGESKPVTLDVEPLYFSVFDTQANHWKIWPGEYKVLVGSSSQDLPLSATVQL